MADATPLRRASAPQAEELCTPIVAFAKAHQAALDHHHAVDLAEISLDRRPVVASSSNLKAAFKSEAIQPAWECMNISARHAAELVPLNELDVLIQAQFAFLLAEGLEQHFEAGDDKASRDLKALLAALTSISDHLATPGLIEEVRAINEDAGRTAKHSTQIMAARRDFAQSEGR